MTNDDACFDYSPPSKAGESSTPKWQLPCSLTWTGTISTTEQAVKTAWERTCPQHKGKMQTR